ncbi:MAG: sulfatase [Planctomycetes bacterium]|nr:sulfatase [Planctomycetota bacterium]
MDRGKSNLMGSVALVGLLATAAACAAPREATDRPNFIVVFTDDQGYGDLGCYGSSVVKTPNIDRLAREGARLTSFYVAAPLCSPSRAALMTGCYPKRVSMAYGINFPVLLAGDRKGLHPDEITIAELLKPRGYATGCFGKWHLGDQAPLLPTRQGFDEYFGIPYSHDIHPYHPRQDHFNFPPLPLLDGERVIEADPNADFLTERVTQRAVSFIDQHKNEPFFLYLPHPLPHKPLHVSPPFGADVPAAIKAKLDEEKDGVDYRTRDKLFPQVIAEVDASVGRIVAALEQHGLDRNTLLIFTSDNGPAVGSAGPLRGRKGSFYEGGMREPTVAWWPGQIKPGSDSDALLTAMDLFPTFARLAGAAVPDDRVIDGRDIWPVLSGQPGAASPHEYFFYHQGNSLRAVRSGPWKLVLERNPRTGTQTGRVQGPNLYNLESDIGEKVDVAAGHRDVVARLLARARLFDEELGSGSALSPRCRPAADVENAQPLVPHPVRPRN